jgi:hypothetical protein
MSEEASRFYVFANLAKVSITPGRSKTAENTRHRIDLGRVPTDAEAIAIERFRPFFRVKTLQDQRVRRPIKQIG